jgi:hypothetical protein
MQLTAEEIEENYNKFVSYVKQTGEYRQEALEKFLNHFEERLALCPGSSRTAFHNCFPGGLVEHSLRVLKNCNRLVQVFKEEFTISKESMIFACLFHDIGKLGGIDEPRYLPQTSDWHAKQGNLYEYNKKMPALQTPVGGLFILQHFGVHMNFEEFQSILLNDGQYDEANRPYAMKEHPLALLVHQADCLATVMEKQRG